MLVSRPAEAERGLAHAGLGDLFEDVLDDVLPALAAPRRRALEVALLLEEASDEGRRSPRARCRGAQRPRASRERGTGCSLQSTTSSGSTRRRRAHSRSRCAGSTRIECSCCSPAGSVTERGRRAIEQALAAERVRRVPVGPLSVGALHRLLRDRLGTSFARQTLLRIHERSGGNPFFALELARVLDADVDPLQPLPVPETLEELVRATDRRAPGGHA